MLTPTLLGFLLLWLGAGLFLSSVLRAEGHADRARRRATARHERLARGTGARLPELRGALH